MHTGTWWLEESEESMDGSSGWGHELNGPFASEAQAMAAATVFDGEIERTNDGHDEHRYRVRAFENDGAE